MTFDWHWKNIEGWIYLDIPCLCVAHKPTQIWATFWYSLSFEWAGGIGIHVDISHVYVVCWFREYMLLFPICVRSCCVGDHMVVGFTTTYAISAYQHLSYTFQSLSWRGVLDTKFCDKVCQWLAAGQWFSQGTRVSSNNKTDCHDITKKLLKEAP